MTRKLAIVRFTKGVPFVVAGMVFFSCTADIPVGGNAQTGQIEQPFISGKDDRRDAYAYPDQQFAEIARAATVALIDHSDIDDTDPDNIRLLGTTLIERVESDYGAEHCPDEAFAHQRVVAHCGVQLWPTTRSAVR